MIQSFDCFSTSSVPHVCLCTTCIQRGSGVLQCLVHGDSVSWSALGKGRWRGRGNKANGGGCLRKGLQKHQSDTAVTLSLGPPMLSGRGSWRDWDGCRPREGAQGLGRWCPSGWETHLAMVLPRGKESLTPGKRRCHGPPGFCPQPWHCSAALSSSRGGSLRPCALCPPTPGCEGITIQPTCLAHSGWMDGLQFQVKACLSQNNGGWPLLSHDDTGRSVLRLNVYSCSPSCLPSFSLFLAVLTGSGCPHQQCGWLLPGNVLATWGSLKEPLPTFKVSSTKGYWGHRDALSGFSERRLTHVNCRINTDKQ